MRTARCNQYMLVCEAFGALALLPLTACAYALPPLSPQVDQLPEKLLQTRLYSDTTMTVLAPDVHTYAPSYELWSDGASKRRYIRVPEGAQIDTSNMDDWVFPVGTKMWKEFTRGGTRVETRLIARVSDKPDGWAAAAYVWDRDQRNAQLSVDEVRHVLE